MSSSESEVIGSDATVDGRGELDGVDFFVERSSGCSAVDGLGSSISGFTP
jgi:hypothetical protein